MESERLWVQVPDQLQKKSPSRLALLVTRLHVGVEFERSCVRVPDRTTEKKTAEKISRSRHIGTIYTIAFIADEIFRLSDT